MQHHFSQLIGLVAISMLTASANAAPIGKRDAAAPLSTNSSSSAPPSSSPSAATPLNIATVLETPMAATLYDPSAAWKAPLVPAGTFNPMPLITKVPVPSNDDNHVSPPSANDTDVKDPLMADLTAAAHDTAALNTTLAAAAVNTTLDVSSNTTSSTTGGGSTKALSDAMLVDHDVVKGLMDSLNLAEDNMNNTLSAASASSSSSPSPDSTNEAVPKSDVHASRRRRRSLKREWTGTLRKRDLSTSDIDVFCPSDERETLVPVTFAELYEMKSGSSKLVPVFAHKQSAASNPGPSNNSSLSNSTTSNVDPAYQSPDCVAKLMATVIVVPVSDMQMSAINDGSLHIKSTEQRGVVTLVTSVELNADAASGTSSVPPSAGEAHDEDDVEGPTFIVVPSSSTSPSDVQKLPTLNTISGTGSSNATADSSPSTAASASDAHATAGATDAHTATANATTSSNTTTTTPTPDDIKRRSRGRIAEQEQEQLVRRANDLQRLERRVMPSKADNTSMILNGMGKTKYGHAIHIGAAPSSYSLQASTILFAVGSILASMYL